MPLRLIVNTHCLTQVFHPGLAEVYMMAEQKPANRVLNNLRWPFFCITNVASVYAASDLDADSMHAMGYSSSSGTSGIFSD